MEIVALAGDEAPRLAHRIGPGLRAPLHPLFSQGALLAAIGAVKPQQRLGDAGEITCRVSYFQRRQIDIREDRIAQHFAQPAGIVGPILGSEIGDVELVGTRQAQQQRNRQWALVAFDQGDIGRRNPEILGHRLLGQPKLAPQALQPGAEIKGWRIRHYSNYVVSSQLYKEKL